MARIKRASLPVGLPVDSPPLTPEDREAMERALAMNIPLAQARQLIPGPPKVGQGRSLGRHPDSLEATQRAVNENRDIENDTSSHDDEQPSGDDTRDSASDEDISVWRSSAAEFDNVDDGITREYEYVDPWAEDFSILVPTIAATQGPATEPNTRASASAMYGLSIQPAWSLAEEDTPCVPSLMCDPIAPSTTVATPAFSTDASHVTQPQSWEIIEKPQRPQLPQPPPSFGWPTGGGFRPALPSRNAGDEEVSSDALRFVSVHPLQPQTPPRVQRRGPFQDRERQEETSRTRGLKACVRCRMQKIRCTIVENDPTGNCGTCLAVSKQKVHYLPCLRYRLTECTLYRTGKAPGLEFTFRWPVMKLKDISEWESPTLRTVLVKSDICPVPLKLVVRKFVPIPHKDLIHRSWVDHRSGVKKFKETTPYAVVNMKNAVHDMREYVTANVFKCMDYFLRGSDQLVKDTYEFARKYMQRVESDEERKLIGNFFRLWFAIRRTATTEHIVGEDTLDMEPEKKDESYPLFGKVPLPPVMIQQLDMILTLGILDPLRKQVLEDFQRLALTINPKNWMTIYLITFMSLHSCAKITAENYHNARKHGLLRRYAIPNFIADQHHSANVFLSHYHYRTESSNPFKQEWKKRHLTPFSHMSVDDIQFLERTKLLFKERENVIKTNRDNDLYEHELYFVSQMLEDNWQPRDTAIEYTEGTVNNVGLNVYVGDDEGGKR
jgi:hypothetical protein